MKQIIQVKYVDRYGMARGKDYAYYTEIPVEVGQFVEVPAPSDTDINGTKKVIVTKVDVDPAVIEPFKDRVKTVVRVVESKEE